MDEILANNFEQAIGAYPGTLLVYFYTPTCIPCRAFMSLLEEVSIERQTSFKMAKVNIAEQPELFSRLNFHAVPTLILFLNGKALKKITGAMDGRHLNKWLNLVLKACESDAE